MKLPGQVRGLAAADPAGPVFVTGFDGRGARSTVLAAVDLAGTTIWRSEFAGRPLPPRAGVDGGIWIARRESAGYGLSQVGADGSTLSSVTPQQAADEHLDAFVVLPTGSVQRGCRRTTAIRLPPVAPPVWPDTTGRAVPSGRRR
ncbi:hypothetical protein [Virgisporangium aliadipatigenens]|uniref:hypothetical protein n=1 Tax=Virgisporangium aliadipatigenens TaxID=741659 RepID=UPI001EF24FA7|nr:hypothetical protein [Virgisporangium aliadipatigenens]